jgi:hypothetical protein
LYLSITKTIKDIKTACRKQALLRFVYFVVFNVAEQISYLKTEQHCMLVLI